MRYPTDVKGLKEYFTKRILKNDAKAKRLYRAALAASSQYASDSEWDNLDSALRGACGGLMNFVNSEKAEEINDEMYCDVLEAVYAVARKAKITISF
jgi:hypothetical protein